MLRDRWLFGRKTSSFTLQWHLTNACEFHCHHCYDRSNLAILALDSTKRILQDFDLFCRNRRVRGHVCLTGGNPILYPNFLDLYRIAVAMGFPISILGNPISKALVEQLVEIQKPVYYQISLEGLPEHNDSIRGKGHFDRAMQFLTVLRDCDIHTHVMLTLTRDNMGQVLPLGNKLNGLANYFTYNRLSQVGEGATLDTPDKNSLVSFMKQYIIASRTNPVLGFKDNLFNIIRYHYHRKPLRGCTGYGCGAAFNFVALLPNGEVHACRKFPSPIGNILEESFHDIYTSAQAKEYRRGCRSCSFCPIRNSCGGCLAVSFSRGQNIFKQKDPHCFMSERKNYFAHTW